MQSKLGGTGHGHRVNADLRLETFAGNFLLKIIEWKIQYNHLLNSIAAVALML